MAPDIFRCTVEGEATRLDKLVVQQLSPIRECSRSQVERWIEAGAVSVNGVTVRKPSYRVDPGDTIEVAQLAEPSTSLKPFEFPLSILFEDEHLIVIDKPAGISMHPGAGERERTLANAVVQHVGAAQRAVGESDRPGIVHRLDKDTTGVVVIAKSTAVHAALARQFAERSTERTYHVLVYATPRGKREIQRDDSGEVSESIGRHPTKRTLMAISERGKRAVTRWRVIERFTYGVLLQCQLETGRTHQIRVHMNHIGSPVIGDPTYGDFSNLPQPLREAARRFGRQALHAATLAFTHPISAKRLSFSASPPSDFVELVGTFRRYE
jgi:23S rRNA pseudouridine1911/1915/1917 synthase